ncbi:DUF2290 domain-containing protein [Arthrobacter sp. ISL-72]|uniref:DUF2290 domain-containing protein n=1 Tax=Arthrobacter sp. ISL-72 TaxID=2819114 RepID=UPI001BE6813D|nr:DUF2290 domain-containing protein [Arthrobacter sp. ISL-72]MBT2596220.1 DUF2290 domain-containing protein [Arthrobacter sp. ISL-72]
MSDWNSLHQETQNVLDYLQKKKLAYFTNAVSKTLTTISWASGSGSGFLSYRGDPTVGQYHQWILDGQYSAILIDGSLLQITYDFELGEVVGHRLAYVPCPFDIEPEFLSEMTPGDAVELYRLEKLSEIRLRSPVRFDFAPGQAKPGHPASHLTINSATCRIACAAPIRIGRFVDFVYRHFYPKLHIAHNVYFSAVSSGSLGSDCISEEDGQGLHLRW